jgi:hypothetical protein
MVSLKAPPYLVTKTLVTLDASRLTLDAGRLLTPSLSPSGGEDEGEGVTTK